MGPEEVLAVGLLATAAVFLVSWGIASREKKNMQKFALELEGDWMEEEVRRGSMPTRTHPLAIAVMEAKTEVERCKERLRRSSIPPAELPPGAVPPPPDHVWAAAANYDRPTFPLPPVFVPGPSRTPKV